MVDRIKHWNSPKTAPIGVKLLLMWRHLEHPKTGKLRTGRERGGILGWLPLSVLSPKPEVDLETGEPRAPKTGGR